jgi:hypothetical protein
MPAANPKLSFLERISFHTSGNFDLMVGYQGKLDSYNEPKCYEVLPTNKTV